MFIMFGIIVTIFIGFASGMFTAVSTGELGLLIMMNIVSLIPFAYVKETDRNSPNQWTIMFYILMSLMGIFQIYIVKKLGDENQSTKAVLLFGLYYMLIGAIELGKCHQNKRRNK